MVHWGHQTLLLDLHVYDAPGVYSNGSPDMLYGDGVFCGPAPCRVGLGDTPAHASFGAPVEKPCTTEAKATTVNTANRAVFMAQGF